jgi:hypothetical protein
MFKDLCHIVVAGSLGYIKKHIWSWWVMDESEYRKELLELE